MTLQLDAARVGAPPEYRAFLKRKVRLSEESGFPCDLMVRTAHLSREAGHTYWIVLRNGRSCQSAHAPAVGAVA